MMKTKTIGFVIILSYILLANACSGTSDKQTAPTDSVAIAQQRLSDTSSFVMSTGERCVIYADATIDYPSAFATSASLDTLQRLFITYVLEATDTLSLRDAMHQCVTNSLHQYDFMPIVDEDSNSATDEDTMTTDAVYKYNTSTNVTTFYNQQHILTFCRVDVVKKNGQVTSVAHHYYNFDLENLCYIDANRLFKEECMTDVCALLRSELMAQNKVTTNEQLNDLGFFNAENITASHNFYFDKQGVTWSFLPNELAVEAVGEPKITIPYDNLKPYLSEGSVLKRIN